MNRPFPITCAPLAAKRAVAGSVSVPADPATPLPAQWRNPPDCKQCGRGMFRCVCEWDEPQQEHFRPALNRDPDRHWIEL